MTPRKFLKKQHTAYELLARPELTRRFRRMHVDVMCEMLYQILERMPDDTVEDFLRTALQARFQYDERLVDGLIEKTLRATGREDLIPIINAATILEQ